MICIIGKIKDISFDDIAYSNQSLLLYNVRTKQPIYTYVYANMEPYYTNVLIENDEVIYIGFKFDLLKIKNIGANYVKETFMKRISHMVNYSRIQHIDDKLTYCDNFNNEEQMDKIINENNFLRMIDYNIINIDDSGEYFNIANCTFVNKIECLYFIRRGGIIRCSDPAEIIMKYFDDSKNLVIKPNNVRSDSFNCKTCNFSELSLLTKKKYNQIIVRELHIEYITELIQFLDTIECDVVWIINTLPLKYYFCPLSSEIKLKQLLTIMNIWSGFSNDVKKKNKDTICHFLMRSFDYLNFDVKYIKACNYVHKKLILNDIEQNIWKSYQNIYNDWEDRLDNNPDNMYSNFNEAESLKLKKKMINSFLNFIVKTESPQTSYNYFNHKINKIITFLKKNKTPEESYVNFLHAHQELSYDESCPICGDKNEHMVLNICSHTYCIDCFIKSISYNNHCSICRHSMTVSNALIIADNHKSSLINLIESYCNKSDTVLIMTKLHIIQELKYSLDNRFYVTEPDTFFSEQIKSLDKVIMIGNDLDNWIGYFDSFEYPPQIINITCNF